MYCKMGRGEGARVETKKMKKMGVHVSPPPSSYMVAPPLNYIRAQYIYYFLAIGLSSIEATAPSNYFLNSFFHRYNLHTVDYLWIKTSGTVRNVPLCSFNRIGLSVLNICRLALSDTFYWHKHYYRPSLLIFILFFEHILS